MHCKVVKEEGGEKVKKIGKEKRNSINSKRVNVNASTLSVRTTEQKKTRPPKKAYVSVCVCGGSRIRGWDGLPLHTYIHTYNK